MSFLSQEVLRPYPWLLRDSWMCWPEAALLPNGQSSLTRCLGTFIGTSISLRPGIEAFSGAQNRTI